MATGSAKKVLKGAGLVVDDGTSKALAKLGRNRRPRRPTIRDVAREAGVAATTASRVLRGDTTLSARPETKRRVEHVAARLGYQPNELARSLRARRADTLAVILADPRNVVWAPMLDGIESAAARAGYLCVIVGSAAWSHGDRALAELAMGRTDGVLVAAPAVDTALLERLDAASIPVIVVHGRVAGRVGSVNSQEREGGRVAAAHLLRLGHERTALVAGRPDMYSISERTIGFADEVTVSGLPPPQVAVVERPTLEAGALAVASLFGRGAAARPTALFVPSFIMAVGALRAFRSLQIDVPREVSVVVLPDHAFAEDLSPPLTAVQVPLRELGVRAVEMLLGLIDGAAAVDLVLDSAPVLIERASTMQPL